MAEPDVGEIKEEPQKPYQQILLAELSTGLGEFRRPSVGLLLSSLSGGLDAGFSLLLMATVWTTVDKVFPQPLTDLLTANMYAVGFIFVVIGRSELFTEHTSRAIFPVLSGHASVGELIRLWTIVYVANTVGIAAFAAVVAHIGPRLGAVDPSAFEAIARPLVEREWWVTLVGAVLAGWMMGLLSWLVSACRDTISQIFIVWLIATSIGMVRLPHAIVGTGEVLLDVFAGRGITASEFLEFLVLATVGNGIGGVVFVALLKYGHSVRGSEAGG